MRAKEKKQKKKEAIIDKTNELTKDPITGKPIKPSRNSEQLPLTNSKDKKRNNTMLTKQPPQLTNIERQRMKNNMQMTLA